jgi:hypothetical protein
MGYRDTQHDAAAAKGGPEDRGTYRSSEVAPRQLDVMNEEAFQHRAILMFKAVVLIAKTFL